MNSPELTFTLNNPLLNYNLGRGKAGSSWAKYQILLARTYKDDRDDKNEQRDLYRSGQVL